uniref:Uncharacterized protein n=1 Tax=Monodon monoceros TaxID=40151 RepID=A0A8C6FEA1_MONMO
MLRRRLLSLNLMNQPLDVQLFLSLEHLEPIVGLLMHLLSILLCLREQGGPRRGRDGGKAGRWSSQNIHIYRLSSSSYMGKHQTSLITDHHRNIIIMKKFEIL